MKRLFAGISALFVLAASGAMVPDGFHFEKNDHFLTPSESLSFTYRFQDGDDSALREGVDYRIFDLANRQLAAGVARAFEKQGRLAVYRLLTPKQVSALKSGWHTLEIKPAADKQAAYFRMKFYVRSGKFAHRVVYLLDSVTPEGFAFWINGDGNLIEPLRDFPEQGKPDCVVVSSYAPLPESKFEALKSYVANGGTALFFGVNHSRLDELNPLKLNRADLYPQSPKKSADGSLVYLLNAELADGAELLKAAGDGSPEIAVKPFGKGRVVAYAGGLKPGAGYDRMIYPYGLGIQVEPTPPERFRAAAPDAGGFREGISRNNFGRFGWLNDDRINAIGLQPDQTFRMWDVDQDYFGVSFSGSHTPGKLAALETGWLGKSMLGTGGRWGQGTEIVWGLGTPGVLHGQMTMLLQTKDGQIEPSHSVSAGLDYPGVGPEHAYLSAIGRVHYGLANDAEALDAFQTLCRTEGILPALESSHALAWVLRHHGELPAGGHVVVNLSGRGDKDMDIVEQHLHIS